MKATVTKKVLSEGLSLLERVVPSRSSNPLLTSLKIEASSQGLSLSGTNLEMDLSSFAPAEVQEPQSLVVPAHLLSQIVRTLGGELVELELVGDELAVRSGGSEFKIQTGDVTAFPELNFPDQIDATVDAADLARALGSVRYAASSEAFQAVFRGVKLEKRDQGARVVASDGYRVALHDFALEGEVRELIMPARSVDELVRMLRDGEAKLSYGEGQLSVTTERVKMNLKLLDGEFPDYERVIPSETKLQVKLASATLKESVGRVAVLADKNANNRVEFLVSEGQLQLNAEGDYGRAHDTLSVEQNGTEPAISLAFNAKYVQDALGPIEGEAEMLFAESTKPAIFRPAAGGGYMAVLVALRV
ncbi:DNA polymerase III subunit beta [Deinococcus radiophilus]|uniref:Beta sliding clamp n=1 Tax=Deinococcus radiophilus TaxID=32062 RepID=A0A431VVK3_9DEIO|nr:DNA polymerase III subunit beta [Deinococcus radiophilus]RTR27049.1 DNA polymerase III subunit beta [Deinococcus radiophilus]UFA50168.1 DNA polymerase III subunit beta [Deinococcus radiophilus]